MVDKEKFRGSFWRRLLWCSRGKHVGVFTCIDCGAALIIIESEEE